MIDEYLFVTVGDSLILQSLRRFAPYAILFVTVGDRSLTPTGSGRVFPAKITERFRVTRLRVKITP